MEHPDAFPGVIPEILGVFANVPPFDEVAALRWFGYGNLCETNAVTFIGIVRDGTVKVTSQSMCTLQEVRVTSTGQDVRLIVPAEPAGMRHGHMNPIIPGDEWTFTRGKLRHVRKLPLPQNVPTHEDDTVSGCGRSLTRHQLDPPERVQLTKAWDRAQTQFF